MKIWSGRRITLPATVAVLAVSALAAANPGTASARPAFAHRYVGTVTGTNRAGDHTDTWTVSGITYTLFNARFARGRWGGNYKLTGGRVTFTSSGTGDCRYVEKGSFALGSLPWGEASIDFLQNLRSSGYAYVGKATKAHQVTVNKKCKDGGGTYSQRDVVNPAGGAWFATDINERLLPGRRIHGSYTNRSYGSATTWRWNLAPRP
jgi:hypothetical protein